MAKARISHPKKGGTLRFLANQGRGCVSSVTSLGTLGGIALRGRDPRVMGHHSPSNQWCDAPKPGGPLTTRQPAEYKWRSGYPTPL